MQLLAEPHQGGSDELVGPLAVGDQPRVFDACEVGGGAEVEHHLRVGVGLQEGGRQRVGDLSLHHLLHDLRLLVAPRRQEHRLGREQRRDAHGQRAGRNLLLRAEAVLHLLARGVADQDEARDGLDARTGFVGGNVAHAADAQQRHVNASEGLDALLVEPATVVDGLLSDAPIEGEDVLRLDVDMVQEARLELIDAPGRVFLLERIVFVGVEGDDVAEAEFLLLVLLDQFFIDRHERQTSAQSHHVVFSAVLCGHDFLLDVVGNVLGPFLRGGEDVGVDFLHAGDFRVFHGRFRLVILDGYFVEYDLRT